MSAARVERFETVVVGGGQAGLAIGAQLARRDIDFVIVTDEARIGDNWRRRWDSLRLFTPARYSGLPLMPFPAVASHFPDKDEVADYLERYAARFDLPLRTNARVGTISAYGQGFRLRLEDGAILEADNVVIATGPFQQPKILPFSTQLSPAIEQLHSSDYRNPFELSDGATLVVGAGSSGSQIALELARFRKVWLAGRKAAHVPRRALGRDVFDFIWPTLTALSTETTLGRWLRKRSATSSDSRIGISEQSLRSANIARVGRISEVRGGLPVSDGEVLEPRVIVWATGYRSNYSWIDLPAFDDNGEPLHERGESLTTPGLFFVGLRFQHRMTSSLVGGVGADAEFIAQRVAKRTIALLTE